MLEESWIYIFWLAEFGVETDVFDIGKNSAESI